MSGHNYSGTPGTNTDLEGVGIQGSDPPSNTDNAFRQVAADLKNLIGDHAAAGTTGGSANAITVAANGEAVTTLTNAAIVWIAASDNTATSVTFAWSNTGAQPLKKASASDGNEADLEVGDVQSDGLYMSVWRPSWNSASGAWQLIDLNHPAVTTVNGTYQSTQYFTASGTWTKPANLARVRVICIGGGGGGGGSSATWSAASGGGGGGCAIKTFEAGSLGATESVTIGAGGAGGISSGAPSAGGNSTFDTLTGNGGAAGTSVSGIGAAPGGAGGSASGGDINITGGAGNCSSTGGTSLGAYGCSGFGGRSYFGEGGLSVTQGANTDGNDGEYGGGGSGSSTNATARTGGAGGDGIIIVEEFFNN